MINGLIGLALALQVIYPMHNASATIASAQDVHEIADICMYSQRLLKDYALIGMKVTYHDPAADLTKNTKIIDQYITNLKSRHLKKTLDDEIRVLETLWQKIKPKLQENPSKEHMLQLRGKVEVFSHRCKSLAEKLAEDSRIKGENNMVLIAELGMESQRLAALYIMKSWGITDNNYYEDVQKIMNEQENIHHILQKADDIFFSPEIKTKLKNIQKHFLVFEFMAASKTGRFVPTMAEKNASKIFREIREIREILKLEQETIE
ncbi:MAG: hypothetical protein L3J84_05265 [Gammaproteobacteria bacterium]|nr:hypothetical protein [Gammaproteobacteria bacterium]